MTATTITRTRFSLRVAANQRKARKATLKKSRRTNRFEYSKEERLHKMITRSMVAKKRSAAASARKINNKNNKNNKKNNTPQQITQKNQRQMQNQNCFVSTYRYQAPRAIQDPNDIENLFNRVSNKNTTDLGDKNDNVECAICLCPLFGNNNSNKEGGGGEEERDANDNIEVVKLNGCGHIFHLDCMKHSLARSKNCPSCRACLGAPQGTSPSGTMTVKYCSDYKLAGFEESSNGTIEIQYDIPDGIQQSYNESPGKHFYGTHRVAYIPDCNDGNALLKRMIYAFEHGLTFTIGTSLTTGMTNTVTWASIHHKTSRWGGPWGYPDTGYFYNANEELDNLNVPK